MSADLILYGLVAAGLVFWLKSLLGTRSGDEPQRPNPYVETPETKRPEIAARTLEGQARTAGILPDEGAPQMELQRHMSIDDSAHPGLAEIGRMDKSFDPVHFLNGAQEAFIMIVEAFAAKDRETLANLLSENVLAGFNSALDERVREKQEASVEIHAVRRAEVLKAWLDGRMAYITVKFIADETNVLKDADGRLLHGHPDRVSETIDIWTFGRDTRSRNPAWLVYETRDEDASGNDNKTVPDMKGDL